MTAKEIHNDDVTSVLVKDGVPTVMIGEEYENNPLTQLHKIKEMCGSPPWAMRIAFNDKFGGVVICQNPGQGNRLHFHPDADECWVILEGEWEWYIEGEGVKNASVSDFIVVPKGVKHQIKCVGDKPAIRFAITAPDVDHVYSD